MNEHHIFVFLIQIFLLLGLSRFGGEIFARFKQPPLTAEILVGIFLGPTILGRYAPSLHGMLFPVDPIQQTMLQTVAWLGVFFFLLETGLEIDFAAAWRQRGEALVIAFSDTIIPFALAFGFAMLLPLSYFVDPAQKVTASLFIATTLTISALTITARALHDLRMTKTDLGFLIMSAMSVNDLIGWFLFTLIFTLFVQTSTGLMQVFVLFISVILFTFVCLKYGRKLCSFVLKLIRKYNLPEPASSLTYIFLSGLLCGIITQKIGIQAIFGFFIAGIMNGQSRELPEKTRQTISQMVYSIFIPIFFASIGLRVDFLKDFDLPLALGVTLLGLGGRFFGAWIGTRIVRMPAANRLAVAVGHIPGGMMEILMALLALEHNLITPKIFIAIVFGAVVTSALMAPWFAYAINNRKEISVFEFFIKRLMIEEIHARDRDEAIKILSQKAADEISSIQAFVIEQAVLTRENVMGTAIEESIALPHARLKGLLRPLVVFARSSVGIEWNSPDGKPTHFIFLILTPFEDDSAQLQILRAIAHVMSEPAHNQAISTSTCSASMWSIFEGAFALHYVKRKS